MSVLVVPGLWLRVKVVSSDVDEISARFRVLVGEQLGKGILLQLFIGGVGPHFCVPENRIFDRETRRY